MGSTPSKEVKQTDAKACINGLEDGRELIGHKRLIIQQNDIPKSPLKTDTASTSSDKDKMEEPSSINDVAKTPAKTPETFNLNITYGATSIVVAVTSDNTIGDVKRMLEEKNNFSFEEQRFLIDNKPCEDVQRLIDYSVKDDSSNYKMELKLEARSKHSNCKNNQPPEANLNLTVGTTVEFQSSKGNTLYGIIKWTGDLSSDDKVLDIWAGLELEENNPDNKNCDGTFKGHLLYNCPKGKGILVELNRCHKDSRFLDTVGENVTLFGPRVTEDIPDLQFPCDFVEIKDKLCGKPRGIQGHNNSCYMDATLFSMFSFTRSFDSLFDSRKPSHDAKAKEAKRILREGIVNPLRRDHYVCADKVLRLRQLLDDFGVLPGMMDKEKDPEEFLDLLFGHMLKEDPFLEICSQTGKMQASYMYQIISEKDDSLVLPTTQELFERSFLEMDLKLKKAPSCLILQMPRFGKEFKMYDRIIPSVMLDITDVLNCAPRACVICERLSSYECFECCGLFEQGILRTVVFCDMCNTQIHKHQKRLHHKPRHLEVDKDTVKKHAKHNKKNPKIMLTIDRRQMELSAVICIQTSHYVSFTKCRSSDGSPWVFFDSMADREGDENGYNIPEIKFCDDLPFYFNENYREKIKKTKNDKDLPEHVRRVLCDAYLCVYLIPDSDLFN